MIDYAGLMTKAAMLRKKLGEDSDSPIDVFALAQRIEGLSLVYYPLGENLSGMCIKGQGENNVVAINSTMTQGRQRFTLAHEFYHLYFDENMVAVCEKNLYSGKDVEKSADLFASYFLMPEAALLIMAKTLIKNSQKQQLTLEDLIHIEQYFGVSHQAIVYRLRFTPYLEQSKADLFFNVFVRSRAELLGYSSDLYKALPIEKQYMTYGHYIKQAEQLFSKGLISTGKYEQLLLDAFRTDLVYGEEEDGDVID